MEGRADCFWLVQGGGGDPSVSIGACLSPGELAPTVPTEVAQDTCARLVSPGLPLGPPQAPLQFAEAHTAGSS